MARVRLVLMDGSVGAVARVLGRLGQIGARGLSRGSRPMDCAAWLGYHHCIGAAVAADGWFRKLGGKPACTQ
eukprot:scaffold61634_cov36-Cyclotella_meneghiniana.AAC.3